MATRQLNGLCYHQKLVILWMFLSGAVLLSSSEVEVEMREPPDFQNSDGSSKFVMKSYFDKYGSLNDSSFEEFMAHELSSRLCEVYPDLRLSVVQEHSLVGEGSHRHLSSSIRLQIEADSIPMLPAHLCEVLLIQRLPIGVFADPFELQHLQERKVFTTISVFGDTNLESPSFRSDPSVVEIHMDSGSNILSRQNNGVVINIQLPLHARYQALNESGYSIVEISEPDILMSCMEGKQHRHKHKHKQSCLFMPPDKNQKQGVKLKSRISPHVAVTWRIPSGRKAHAGFVSVVTFVTAFLSTLSIVLATIFCSGIKASKNMKQS